MSTLDIDVFWSFRSPWSYLATPRLRAMQEAYDLNINFRPVYPIAIRSADFFNQVNPLWFSYFMTDVFRVAESLELPCIWPKPDPVSQFPGEDGRPRTAEEQPFIHRLTRLGIVASEQGKGIEFADEISRLIWSGTENWTEGDHLAKASEKAGLDLNSLDQIAENEVDRLEAQISKNQDDHEKSGHWGVPTCTFQGEPFFGQDRLDILLWRLKQKGLKAK